jgi:hypothetical protein
MSAVVLNSIIACPMCGHMKDETMPTDACTWFYKYEHCKMMLKPP